MAFKDQQESLNFTINWARDDSNLEEGDYDGASEKWSASGWLG